MPPRAQSRAAFKVLLLGDSSVGKTCLLRRATGGKDAKEEISMSTLSTVGVDLAALDVLVEKDKVRLQIWDTAGQEKYRSIAESFYRGAAGIFLTYDLTRKATFASIETWLASISAHTEGAGAVVVVLLANKSDLAAAREVSEASGRAAAATLGFDFCEVSALTGEGVQEAVVAMAASLLARARAAPPTAGKRGFAEVDFVELAERPEPPPPADSCAC